MVVSRAMTHKAPCAMLVLFAEIAPVRDHGSHAQAEGEKQLALEQS